VRRRSRIGLPVLDGPLAGLTGFCDLTPVASGGTSQVFRAYQSALDRLVAVKVIGSAAVDPRSRARFERELSVTGRLGTHPLVATVLDHGVTEAGYPYLVMPWYDAGSLEDHLRRHGRMPVPTALAMGVRVALALAHVHGQSLVHRDVKPGNVLLSTLGTCVLADFGGVTRQRDAAAATIVVSPLHVAPEVLGGEVAAAAGDVWSLCSTLCTALTGVPPSVIAGTGGQLVRDLTRLAEPPSPLTGPGIHAALSDLMLAGLSPRPQDRPGAEQVAAGLQGVQAELGLAVTDVADALAGNTKAWVCNAASTAAPPPAAPQTAPTGGSGRVAADAAVDTLLRPAPTAQAGRWSLATAARAAVGAAVGAGVAVALLVAGRGVLLPDHRTAGAEPSPAVVQRVSDAVSTTRPEGVAGPPSR
jgi:serine/threonine-protein kinase PknK